MFFRTTLALAAIFLPLVALAETKLQVTTDKPAAIYEPGEAVVWKVVAKDGETLVPGKITYTVKRGGLKEIAKGEATGSETTVRHQDPADAAKAPGVVLLEVTFKPDGDGKELKASGAAVYSPEKITRSTPVPADFDEFWKTKIAELDAVPMNVQVEKVDIGDANIEYYKITMDNIRGRKIYGQLAKPVGGEKLPALLQVQWAGVYPLNRDWVLGPARQGRLAFNIIAHGLPIDEPAKFYQEKAAKELSDYPGQGNDDRETSYFLPMFLSCRRAVDYLTQRPDWDKKHLVVQGGSQGGYQAIVTAGIHPAVTAFAANVPAGCDHTGKQAGRAPGWPNWASRQKKDVEKMLETSRYFDAMNFATRVKVPGLIGLGLIDPVCPAEGVLATCNELQGPEQIVIMPLADHGGDHKAYYAKFGPFLDKQLKD
ncbi:Acetyl esterase Axe7A precursor [Anatilimnocola aggregata]|uniref:Acetyl esterase Axe7A n=1 Tax=Anatilimnocola aggregata TaxID=2528021 RepID=A0A517Y674_9BACT|nr:acetylxylan esterase [Anatilimnocola aggregata]QDU25632.1 Acetyl esterase Axe7A precursor [Anatilimnocola aggregata]